MILDFELGNMDKERLELITQAFIHLMFEHVLTRSSEMTAEQRERWERNGAEGEYRALVTNLMHDEKVDPQSFVEVMRLLCACAFSAGQMGITIMRESTRLN